jgi:hypothetical protein
VEVCARRGGRRAGGNPDAAAEGVYAAGDWVAGEGRVDAALQNGLETGEALADSFRESGASRDPGR